MTRLLIIVFSCSILAFPMNSAFAGFKGEQRTMIMGQVDLIDAGTVTRVAVGDDEVVSTSVLENGQIMVIPLKAGDTELLVWTLGERLARYHLTVFPGDMQKMHSLVSALVDSFPRVNVRLKGELIVLEGEVDPIDSDTFTTAIGSLPEGIFSFVKPVPAKKEMIRVKVQVLEVDKRYRKDLGIDWDDTAQGPIAGTIGTIVNNPAYRLFPENDLVDWEPILGLIPASDKTFYPYAGLATTLSSRINLLQENGGGRILAEPTLTTRSGEEATFLAGGEIPYPLIGDDGQVTVEFREYGIRLGIQPIVDRGGNITSVISAEVSSIDEAVTVLGVPGLLIRETESTVNLNSGETIAISGLLSTSDTKNIDSIPLLGEIPILGKLFRSESFQEQRTEIVFLVTPEIVEADTLNNASETLLKSMKTMYEVQGTGGHFADKLID